MSDRKGTSLVEAQAEARAAWANLGAVVARQAEAHPWRAALVVATVPSLAAVAQIVAG